MDTKKLDDENQASMCRLHYIRSGLGVRCGSFWRISPVLSIRIINITDIDWWNTTKSQFISSFYFMYLMDDRVEQVYM